MQTRWLLPRSIATASLVLVSSFVTPARAQRVVPSPLGWSGWARCDVTVQGPGYADQQTHTWTMGGAPSVSGAFRVYPATWSVVGGGSLQRTQGTQSLTAQWATNAPATSAPMAVFVRASDGRMFIQSRHTQLRARAAIQGFQQQTIDGKAQTPATISLEAFEWLLPAITVPPPVATPSGPAPLVANGSVTLPTTGSVGPMQPAGSQGSATCTWQFGQGSAAPAAPAALPARAVPTPP